MKRLVIGLLSTSILFSISEASQTQNTHQNQKSSETSVVKNAFGLKFQNRVIQTQQNLIGEVTGIDASTGRITLKTESAASVIVSINEKTLFRRVMPGQTSIANAEQITLAVIQVGDRVLIPGASATDQTPARQVIVMPRAAINAQRNQELENQRARTFNGRVTAVNPQTKEITIQTRGAGGVETVTVAAPENARLLRYAPDSLRVSDAQAGSFTDLRAGDQIRLVGDRSSDGARITAEEVVFGSVSRAVGSVVDVNAARNEVTVRNSQTGQTMTVFIGNKTALRRIPDEVAESIKQRANRRNERQGVGTNQQTADNPARQPGQRQPGARQNRRVNRDAAGGQQNQGNRGLLRLENLPTITASELKKGDAVLLTLTGGADNARLTAVSIMTGDADLQQILQRMQGGRNNQTLNSPGLPGNVGGGNAAGDNDEPRN